jgi:hypothetical protein
MPSEMPMWGQPPSAVQPSKARRSTTQPPQRQIRSKRCEGGAGLQARVNIDDLKTVPDPCINFPTDQVPDTPPTPGPTPQPRGPTIIAAGLLLAALALVVIYTSRRAFLSPVAMVVVAAIGLAALLLQRRLRPDLRPDLHSDPGPGAGPAAQSSSPQAPPRAPLRLNAAGVLFAIAAVFADVLHLNPALTLITALAAVISFAISGVIVLNALRKPRP